MADPGYGPNGERTPASGLTVWLANGPILTINEADDVWGVHALGLVSIPFISQSDDEAMTYIYPGGVL